MTRFTYCLALLAVFAGFAPVDAAGKQKKKRPNILLIYTDDHSHRTVSCYSEAYPWARTPNIDKLAKTGVRFRYAYIGTWCMPSRATILTGHHQFGVQSMRMEGAYPGSTYDPQQCPFWPAIFRQLGYYTAQIGKWHTGTDTGFGRDWDYQKVWNRPRFPKNAANYFYDQLIETNGGKAKMTKGYSTDNYTEWGLDFIKGKNRDPDKPWFLWLCYGAVHGPFTPADRHMKAYPNPEVPTPKDIYPPRAGKPAYMQKIEQWVKGKDGQPVMKGGAFKADPNIVSKGIHGNTLTDWVRQYHQGVLAIDEALEKIVATLKETGQYENTLIIFTSDQGFAWGQHGFRTKIAPYDSNLRSPMIISFPGRIPAGKTCETPIGGVDIAPTIFSYAGYDLPWKMHGHNLKPLLENPKADWPHPVLMPFTGRRYGKDTDVIRSDKTDWNIAGVPWYVFLRQGRYKYIRTFVDNEIEELYDTVNDPDELTNLAVQKQHAATVRRYRAATIAELRRTNAGFVDNMPKVRPLPE